MAKVLYEYCYISSASKGIVIKQISVESSTLFAASSVSLLCISARLRIMDAHGTEDRISTLALKAASSGRKYTAP